MQNTKKGQERDCKWQRGNGKEAKAKVQTTTKYNCTG